VIRSFLHDVLRIYARRLMTNEGGTETRLGPYTRIGVVRNRTTGDYH
jgi:hypothetical protein